MRRDATRAAVALADTAFGGGTVLERSAFAWPRNVASEEPRARATHVATLRARADAEALALAHELLTDPLVDAIAEFVASPAAAGLWSAETAALGLFPWQGDDFIARAAGVFADPDRCGHAARARLAGLERQAIAGEVSISPALAAIQVAALGLREEHARAFAAFHAGPAGAAWLAVRAAAWRRSMPRYDAALADLRAAGFLAPGPVASDDPDLVLPRAELPTPRHGR